MDKFEKAYMNSIGITKSGGGLNEGIASTLVKTGLKVAAKAGKKVAQKSGEKVAKKTGSKIARKSS